MVNTVWVNAEHGRDLHLLADHGRDFHPLADHGRDLHPLADHGRDLHPLADHMTKLRHFSNVENRVCSAIIFLLQVMLEQALTTLIVCLIKNDMKKSNKRASMLQWILSRFGFSQNYFEVRLQK